LLATTTVTEMEEDGTSVFEVAGSIFTRMGEALGLGEMNEIVTTRVPMGSRVNATKGSTINMIKMLMFLVLILASFYLIDA